MRNLVNGASSGDTYVRKGPGTMKKLRLSIVAMALAAASAAFALQAQAEVSIVDGKVSQALTGTPGDAEAGRKAMINRKQGNCLACHAVTTLSSEPYHGEVGPSLDGVADRYDVPQLRAILVDSKAVFEGTMMPSFYKTTGFNRVAKKFADKTILTDQQVEDVIAYLMTLKEN